MSHSHQLCLGWGSAVLNSMHTAEKNSNFIVKLTFCRWLGGQEYAVSAEIIPEGFLEEVGTMWVF